MDDDPRLLKVVSTLLRRHHHRVEAVPTGELARQALRRGNVDITLLDVNLPDVNGLSLVLEMRQEGNDTPVILLTVRTEVHDQTLGLRLGGDDYIAKPFNPEVLLARIEAVLRRCYGMGTAQRDDPADDNLLEIPPIVIDFAARQVRKDGEVVRLAPLEYSILAFLAANRGRAVSKEELMLDVWGTSRGVTRTLAEHISRLRRKLGAGLIVTQIGYGYLVPRHVRDDEAISR
ncbi:response regulator transcription factor [Actinomadura xylanilytica]|uniref:response regulator transcription factor n=1 Tax=Actinomadura xylanilytica TaxID=887459 RepID=UPI00255AF11F|nr:response regulator transcription factor [Actinomadura xylanilytica]MDL4772965.1 response regulator transcription factor [Actinomadura xylanilytica]